jgi:aryl-alcohol dehydrogenase-like predicted oxidoreductase
MRSRLVLGTFDVPEAQLLDRFIAGGGRALDVANVYRDGESARAVGRWLRGSRADVVLYAKGCHPPHCRPELVAAEVDSARALLGRDRIDVFLLHRDDPSRRVADWADALLEQVRAGTIGAFGVSNWTVGRLLELHGHLDAIGADHLRAFSNHFSLAEMVSAPWEGCLALSVGELHALGDLGVGVITWSSLATGYFAGRDVPSWDSPVNRARRDRAARLAGELGTSAAAVALAYVLHQPSYVLPAFGTTSESHLDDALAAADLALTPDQVGWLEQGARQPA